MGARPHLDPPLAADKGDAQIEREALALTFGVQHIHKYLIGRRFTLVYRTTSLWLEYKDQKQGIPTLAAVRLQRWALIASAYEYDLIDVYKGKGEPGDRPTVEMTSTGTCCGSKSETISSGAL